MTSTTRTMLIIGAVLSSSLAGYACQTTPSDAHEDGVEAQREADRKTSEANKQAGEKMAEANREVAATNDNAKATAAEAQAKANEKIREDNRVVVGDRDELRSWGQKEMDTVDGLIDDATAKVQTGTPKAKANFNAGIDGVKKQRDVLNTELASLEGQPAAKRDKSKAQFSEHIERIKLDIRSLAQSN